MRRLLVILLSPAWLLIALISLAVGLAFYAQTNPAALYVITADPASLQAERTLYLLARIVLFPFQIIFVFMTFSAALWIFRRRQRLAAWLLGEPLSGRFAIENDDDLPFVLRPQRRRTRTQIVSSIIAVVAIIIAIVLALGQIVPRAELAVVIAALTSGLTWGARLPVGDVLGGLTNIVETTVTVGERISYRQLTERVEGTVESMDLRFINVRADSGELTTIPHGELRIFRNYSRGAQTGVHATFPIAARDLGRAVALLGEMAAAAADLVPGLIGPWQVMSLDGKLGPVIDLSVYGRTTPGNETELHLAIHALVLERLAAAGIAVGAADDGDVGDTMEAAE